MKLFNSTCHRTEVLCRSLKWFPVHTMRLLGGIEIHLHSFLTLVWDGSEVHYVQVALPYGKEPLALVEWEADWVPDPFWAFLRRGECLAPSRSRIPNCAVCSLVTLCTLPWLLFIYIYMCIKLLVSNRLVLYVHVNEYITTLYKLWMRTYLSRYCKGVK